MAPLSSTHPQTLRKIAWKSTRSKSASVMAESSAERGDGGGLYRLAHQVEHYPVLSSD